MELIVGGSKWNFSYTITNIWYLCLIFMILKWNCKSGWWIYHHRQYLKYMDNFGHLFGNDK